MCYLKRSLVHYKEKWIQVPFFTNVFSTPSSKCKCQVNPTFSFKHKLNVFTKITEWAICERSHFIIILASGDHLSVCQYYLKPYHVLTQTMLVKLVRRKCSELVGGCTSRISSLPSVSEYWPLSVNLHDGFCFLSRKLK